ncbi:AAA family ATPase [Ornithinibacillus halotolerans]|uniref:Tunicamycin resistance protein n=1 Tax=Ornithinibacillus halotolerans TaxID=1274357 RepID=A0A916RTH3_9BACI|nr:AAA family ATPase [Ornithinibacillus halotolerans]GGA68214.1 tunicamycin resistance protein [Ornithinibacillus halotolerans]
MIILLNGAYGVGKTTIANELLTKVDNSILYDPEEVGYMLRNIITDDMKKQEEHTDNFQDLLPWKRLVVTVAKELITTYEKNLIIPMTIYKKEYLSYIINGIKECDPNTFHFCLIANKSTIHNRLLKRGEEAGNWCFQQTDRCLEAFQDDIFQIKINTDQKSSHQVVEEIMKQINSL